MVRNKRIPTHADPLDAQRTGLPSAHFQRPTGPEHRWVRRPLAATMWIVGCMALFAFYLRISFIGQVTSDGANNALQAWDMLHGHLLLHGWIIGDATYYTFDLPVLAVTEMLFGLCALTSHVASALTYLIVTVSAVAMALTDSRGLARVARCGVVVVVLTVMFHVESNAPYLLGAPDHTGTSALLLVFVPADRPGSRPAFHATPAARDPVRRPDRRRHHPLCRRAGSRPSVRLPRSGRTENPHGRCRERPGRRRVGTAGLRGPCGDAAFRRVPDGCPQDGDLAARAMAAERSTGLARHARPVRGGGRLGSPSLAGDAGYVLGLACLLAAAAGFARVAWTWRTASRAEQLLCAAIVINISVYVISTMPVLGNPYEIVAVLPCGAVLAARACVPGDIGDTLWDGMATGLVAMGALLPLTAAAAQPSAAVPTAPLSAWLKAHGLTYGLAGYWNSSVITLESGNPDSGSRGGHERSSGHPV